MAIKRVKKSLICPRTKRFESIYVCAANCKNRCFLYNQNICIEVLEQYIQLHPEYEIIGELMPEQKLKPKPKEKSFLTKNKDGLFMEVSEKTIINNPKEYMESEIWEKSPNQYELVVSLRRKK